MLLKIFLKMVKNSFDLAFNFHVKICLDLDLAPYDKVVEFKFLKKTFIFIPNPKNSFWLLKNVIQIIWRIFFKKRLSSPCWPGASLSTRSVKPAPPNCALTSSTSPASLSRARRAPRGRHASTTAIASDVLHLLRQLSVSGDG
jgi:hypothetical protein